MSATHPQARRPRNRASPAPPRSRRGSVYVLLLTLSMVITMAGLTSLTISRIAVRARGESDQWVHAQALARAGVEYTLDMIDDAYVAAEIAKTDWRSGFTSGDVSAPVAFANGSFTWMVEDADGNFGDDPADSFDVTATATVGDAVYSMSVTMAPGAAAATPAESCLAAAICAGTDLLPNSAVVSSIGLMHANDDIASSGTTFDGDVSAVGIINGGHTVTGTSTPGAPALDIPSDPTSYYVANGTAIAYTSLISGQLISPATNPYGSPDPNGIYVMDCAGNMVTIEDSRIVGTLVLVNANQITIRGAVSWEPALPNYPSLVASAIMVDFGVSGAPLAEATVGVNFNPSGTPVRGEADTDMLDTFQNAIAGVVFVDGTLRVPNQRGADLSRIDGCLVTTGSIIVQPGAKLTVRYQDLAYQDRPPGFEQATSSDAPRVVAGSVRHNVN